MKLTIVLPNKKEVSGVYPVGELLSRLREVDHLMRLGLAKDWRLDHA